MHGLVVMWGGPGRSAYGRSDVDDTVVEGVVAFAGDDVGAVVWITGGEGAGSVDDAGGIAEVAVAVVVVECIGIAVVETQGRRSGSYVRGAGSRAVEVEGVYQKLKRRGCCATSAHLELA